jgi:hypothetical protein
MIERFQGADGKWRLIPARRSLWSLLRKALESVNRLPLDRGNQFRGKTLGVVYSLANHHRHFGMIIDGGVKRFDQVFFFRFMMLKM